jgi:hypothetical protein
MRFVPDSDEWLRRRLSNWTEPNGEWILGADGSGGIGMTIYPTLPLGTTVVFNYLAKGCVKLASGGYNDAFLADNDSFILDERLLKLGMIWQWKQNKGTSYAEDMGTYETALSVAAGHDRPAPIIVGRRPISANARTAYPWPVPT